MGSMGDECMGGYVFLVFGCQATARAPFREKSRNWSFFPHLVFDKKRCHLLTQLGQFRTDIELKR